jgi:peptidoglycan/LPS O-acetylase OafA/YrhL
LNGFRAIAVLLVVMNHVSAQTGSPLAWLPPAGDMGVQMFFVISGFLITLLLERERRKTQTISLKRFYVRRFLRIVPAFAFFLLVMFVIQLLGYHHIAPGAWLTAATYTSSLVTFDHNLLGHTWSLSVEEHFYIIWPFVFLMLGRRRAFYVSAAYVVACPAVRVIYHFFARRYGGTSVSFFTFCQIDCIAVGCCLAIIATSPVCRAYLWPAPRWFWYLGVGAAVLLVGLRVGATQFGHERFVGLYQAFMSPTANSILMAVVIWGVINGGWSPLPRLLNSRPFEVVGVLSYGIYLWQQPLTHTDSARWVPDFPLNMCLIVVVASLSYTLIESPFLNLKRRFSGSHAEGG